MGSMGGEVESQPSTSNCNNKYKLPRTLLVGCDAVKHASVPRKLRSAIKKRVRESITSPLSISKRQRHASNVVDTLKKDDVKKSKLKKGHVSKDEEEVAETLFALASMFSEPTDMKSSAILETGNSLNAVEDIGMTAVRKESTKISPEVIPESTCHLDSKAQFVKSQSSGGGKKRVVIDLEQVPASEAQYDDNYYSMDDKYNGLFQSPIRTPSSETRRSFQRLPAWLENTKFASQPRVTENSISNEKGLFAVQSNKSWKRSSAHVYISRLTKVFQISEKNDEGSPEKPTQLTTVIDGRNCSVMPLNDIVAPAAEKGSSGIKNNVFPHKSSIQDWRLATETTSALYTAKEGYDFLSLGSQAGQSYKAPKQVHASNAQSKNHPSNLFSVPQNGYSSSTYYYGNSSALAAQQVQLPQKYYNSTVNGNFTAQMGRQLELQQQQKRADNQLRAQYNGVGVDLPDWKNEKMDPSSTQVNCAQALFPHLLGSTKYQQFIPTPQQQPLMSIDLSSSLPSVKMNQHRQFSLGFERNGGPVFYYGNAQQFLR